MDANFGTGLTIPADGRVRDAAEQINAMRKPVSRWISFAFSEPPARFRFRIIHGVAVQADVTVTFQFYKAGTCSFPARQCGDVIVSPAGNQEKSNLYSAKKLEMPHAARL